MAKEEVIILEAPALDENFTPINDEIGFEEEDTKPRISDEEKALQQEQKKRKILRISSFILGLLLAIVTVFLASFASKSNGLDRICSAPASHVACDANGSGSSLSERRAYFSSVSRIQSHFFSISTNSSTS